MKETEEWNPDRENENEQGRNMMECILTEADLERDLDGRDETND